MSLFAFYGIVIALNVIVSFSQLSRGSFFTEGVKAVITVLSIIVLIALCVMVTISYSWIHIFGLVVAYLISVWTFAFIFKSLIFKW